MLGLLGLVSFAYGAVTAVSQQVPALEPTSQPEENSFIYDSTGHHVLAVLRGRESRTIVPSKAIAPIMKQAIVAVEDKRFYEHRGVDVRGIVRAIWADFRHDRVVQGGSTITQQFVKNAITSDQRSLARKLREAALAWQLEQHWTKDQILTAYLNTIYFGNGAYGVQQAAETYFGVTAANLTLPQAALLAGIPQDPSLYDPVANPQAARARRHLVLQAMLEQADVTWPDYVRANRTPLPAPDSVRRPGVQGPAPYFANFVKDELVRRYGSSRVFGGGLRVKTTIDLQLQKLAQDAVAKWLPSEDGPAAALVALDPRNGRVLAMVGGRSYRTSQFNLAVQGERQPGSSFKPFVLAAALRDGISPATTFVSKPVTIPIGGRVWPVHNYEDAYLGPIDLRTATTESDNAVFAQLTALVGPSRIADTAHRLGITSPLQDYFAIGLGADAVNPLEMARAYGSFATGGLRVDGSIFGDEPRAILSVDGKPNAPVARRVLSPLAADEVTELLQGVVTGGTGRRAALADRPAAGKTGTTENYGDAWFVGYTPQLVTAVWVGYPSKLVPMLTEFNGEAVAGGTFPALIWKSFMESALPHLKDDPQPFDGPPLVGGETVAVVQRDGRVERDNGLCRNVQPVVFYSGYGPSRVADCKENEVEVPSVVGSTLADARARLAAQPLTPMEVYKPAAPAQPVGVVLDQIPRHGTLSSFDKVMLVVAKPLHGVVPRVVGMDADAAAKLLARRRLRPVVRKVPATAHERSGTVLEEKPAGGVAAAPGMAVTLVVATG